VIFTEINTGEVYFKPQSSSLLLENFSLCFLDVDNNKNTHLKIRGEKGTETA